MVRSYQRLCFIERSEVPPALLLTVDPTRFVGPREKILLRNVLLTVLSLPEDWPRMTSTFQASADALCLQCAVAASES